MSENNTTINKEMQQEVGTDTSMTSYSVTPAGKDTMKAFNSALDITGIAMGGIFLFMLIFFFVIKGIEKAFPYKPEAENDNKA